MRKHFLILAAAALAACAGRSPNPVATVQPEDPYLDCTAIEAEIAANNTTLQGLASEEGGKVAQNVVAGVVGLFIWPVWFGMDFQGAASKEEAALQSRQQYLTTLALERNCAGAPAGSVAAIPQPPTMPPAAPAPRSAMAVGPLGPTALPEIPMTPCGQDRPCSSESNSSSGY
jgi:hypothetical protein